MLFTSTMASDYYSILQITPRASTDEVKKAYRRLVRQFHPDASDTDDAKERFHQIQEAYDVLSDPPQRAAYDRKQKEKVHAYQKNQSTVEKGRTRTTSARDAARSDPPDEKLYNILRDYNEKRAEVSAKRQGTYTGSRKEVTGSRIMDSSVFKRIKKSVVDSIHKTSTVLRSDTQKQSTSKVGIRPAGQENVFNFTIDAIESLSETTREIALPSGESSRIIRVRIPAGIRDGAILKVNCPASGKSAARELEVKVQVEPHPLVERVKDDVVISLPITVYEAITGATIECPTPDGMKPMRIPTPWTPETRIRLEGAGLNRGDGKKRGDIYVKTYIVLPEVLNDACKNAAQVLEEFQTGPVRRNIPQFFKRPTK